MFELRACGLLIKKYWLYVVAGVVLGAVIGAGASLIQGKPAPAPVTYAATGKAFVILTADQASGWLPDNASQLTAFTTQLISGIVAFGLPDETIQSVIGETGWTDAAGGQDLAEFRAAMTGTSANSTMLQVVFTGADSGQVSQIATLLVNDYLDQLEQSLPAGVTMSKFRSEVSVAAVEPAPVASGQLAKNLLIGASIGLIVGVCVAGVLYARRRFIIGPGMVATLTDLGIVADLSQVKKGDDEAAAQEMAVLVSKLALQGDTPIESYALGYVTPVGEAAESRLTTALTASLGSGARVVHGNDTAPAKAGVRPVPAKAETAPDRTKRGATGSKTVVAVTRLPSPAGLTTAASADVSLVVAEVGRTPLPQLRRVLLDMQQAGISPKGIVLV